MDYAKPTTISATAPPPPPPPADGYGYNSGAGYGAGAGYGEGVVYPPTVAQPYPYPNGAASHLPHPFPSESKTNPAVELRNKQINAIVDHVKGKISYKKLLESFPLPRDESDDLYVKAMGHGINPRYWAMLNVMKIFNFAFVIDNSGSMDLEIDNSELPRGKRRRYDELLFNSTRMLDICTMLDSDGIDVYTINSITSSLPQEKSTNASFYGSKFGNVKSVQDMEAIFAAAPDHSTPLSEAVRAAIMDNKAVNTYSSKPKKPLMLLVATDGEPNNPTLLKEIIKGRNREEVFVTFLVCTDKDSDVEYLNDFDASRSQRSVRSGGQNKIDGVEVIDDYRSERKEVLKKQGNKFGYSRGDHEARKICGPVFPMLDKIDEVALPDFREAGEKFMPTGIRDIVLNIAKSNSVLQRKMQEYGKKNPEIAKYMLDLPRSASSRGCCIVM